MNDGIDWGRTSGIRFGQFVYALLSIRGDLTDQGFGKIVSSEFPKRKYHPPKTIQHITGYRKGLGERYRHRLGIQSDAESAKVLNSFRRWHRKAKKAW